MSTVYFGREDLHGSFQRPCSKTEDLAAYSLAFSLQLRQRPCPLGLPIFHTPAPFLDINGTWSRSSLWMSPWQTEGPGFTRGPALPHEAVWGSVVQQQWQGKTLPAEFLITNAELQIWSPTSICVKQVQETWQRQDVVCVGMGWRGGAGQDGLIKCRMKAMFTLLATVVDCSAFLGSGAGHPASTGSRYTYTNGIRSKLQPSASLAWLQLSS